MSEYKYVAPKSLKEAIALISEYKGKAGIMAGGTDLLAKMKKGLEIPEVLINIEDVRDLNYINYNIVDGLSIGAATPLSSIVKSAVIQSKFSVLAKAAGMMASPTIRNKATIGGNICNAAPSADIVPALIVLGASIKITSMDGDKVVPIEEFFTGPGQTVLRTGQILTEIQLTELPPGSGATYLKHKRREGADLAVVGVAGMVTLEGGSCNTGASGSLERVDIKLKDIRIALGAVSPTPIRAKKAEDILRGQKVTDELLKQAGQIASGESKPIDDARGSADYRKKLVAVFVARAVKQAIGLAQKEALP